MAHSKVSGLKDLLFNGKCFGIIYAFLIKRHNYLNYEENARGKLIIKGGKILKTTNQRVFFKVLLMLMMITVYATFFLSSKGEALVLAPARFAQATFRSINIGAIAPNEIIIKYRPGVSQAQINGLLATFGIRGIEANILSGTQRLVVPSSNIRGITTLLNQNPLVLYAEPNYIARAELLPNDPYYIYQWNFPMIEAGLAWDLSIGRNVVVAVIDTGVAYENQGVYAVAPDFSGTLFTPGWDFVNNDAFADDDNGHGTHIAGTIAQSTNNLLGVAGLAYGCTIMPVKVLDSASNGLITDIADGIYYAVNNGAQIINISFGTYTASLTLQEAVDYAYQNGVSIITSAGNSAVNYPHYPSSYPTCVCVTAVRYDQTRPFYANYGADIDICAPGGDLSLDQNQDGQPDGICQQTHDGTIFTQFEYALFQGTSCSAAHASGVAALVLSASGGLLTPDQIKSALETTATDLGTVGWDQDYGWGLINAFRAVQSVLPATVAAVAGSVFPFNLRVPFSNSITFAPPSLFPLSPYQMIAPWYFALGEGFGARQSATASSTIGTKNFSLGGTETNFFLDLFSPTYSTFFPWAQYLNFSQQPIDILFWL